MSVGGNYANEGNYFCVASNSYGATTSSVVSLGVQYAWSEYGYSGGWQSYTVPSGVTDLAVDAVGAGGGTAVTTRVLPAKRGASASGFGVSQM